MNGDNQYDMESAIQAADSSVSAGAVDIKLVGQKVKQIYPNGRAKDGRKYSEISDEEMGSKYVLANGDKGLSAIGMSKTGGDRTVATNLRKEFRQETNDLKFKDVRDAWGRMEGAADTPTGDLSIAYAYVKLLDPNSAVKEGELATTENTRGLSDKVLNAYNKVVNGKRLSENQRQGFLREGSTIYNNVANKQKELSSFYSGLASDSGVNPQDVIGSIGDIKLAEVPETTPRTGLAQKAIDTLIKQPIKTLGNFAQDVGAGAGMNIESGTQQSMDEALKMADEAERKAAEVTDPEQKARLLEVARSSREKISQLSGNREASFSEDVTKPNVQRALETGAIIAGAAEIPGLVTGARNAAGKITGAVAEKGVGAATEGVKGLLNKVNPFNIYGNKRAAAAKALEEAGINIDETKIAQDVFDYATEKAPLTMKRSSEKYAMDAIEKFKNPQATITETLENLKNANESAFLQSGVKGRAVSAKIEKIVGDSIRKQISERAPDVAAANKAFEQLYKGGRFLKSLKFPASIAAGTSLAGSFFK